MTIYIDPLPVHYKHLFIISTCYDDDDDDNDDDDDDIYI